jgi:hypothetical protein
MPVAKKKRTGGKATKERDHEQNIFFHEQNANEIAEYLYPHYKSFKKCVILDACSGLGVLGNAFSKRTGKTMVFFYDKKDGADILKAAGEYDLIVCNPPWRLSEALPIYEHLLNLLSPNGILFFIINNVFCYQGSDRAEKLCFQKYYFLPRWTFKPAGRPLLDCGIMVYHKNGIIPQEAANLRPYIPLKKVEK